MLKWQRNYILSIQTDNGYIDITMPFTLNFRITRNTMASANTAKITLYNLSEGTRRKIYKDKYKTNVYKGIELRAGYGDRKETLPLIFKGNILQAYSQREAVDYRTDIECYDGGFALVNGLTNRAFDKNTPEKQIIKSLIEDLPNTDIGKIGNFDEVVPRGNSMQGNTAGIIKEITKENFFIDNEKVYCLKENECFLGNIREIKSASGLMGSPLREETFLTFTMLFEPRLQIGQYIKLTSETEKLFNGEYKVLGIEHNGVISDAQSGTCTTKVSLYYGALPLQVI